MTEGNAAYTLPQNTDQNLTLTWSVADATIASISGNKLTPLKAGTTTVTATQAGNNDYLSFSKTFTLTVKAKQAQTLSLTELPEMMEGEAAYTLPQNTDQNLTLTWSVADATIASISGNKLTPLKAGTTTVTATQAGNYDYLSFSKTFTLTVKAKQAQTLSLTELPEMMEGDAAYTLPQNTDQNLTLTWSVADATIASISGNKLTPLKAGTTTVTATQAGNNDYLSFTQDYTLTVNEAQAQDNRLFVESVSIRQGEKTTFCIKLDNTKTLIAFEFFLQLPNGFSIETGEDGYFVAELVNERINRHSLEVKDKGNGLYYFLCYSNRNNSLIGNSGDLISLSVVCDESVEAGTYMATLKDIMFSDENKNKVELLDSRFSLVVTTYLLGDLNDDRKTNVMDVVEMVSCILDNRYNRAGDFDGNGKINVMDLVNEVELVMSNSDKATSRNDLNPIEFSDSEEVGLTPQ